MPLRCKVFARLNNCANCDKADVSFVQTQKKRKVSIMLHVSTKFFHMNLAKSDGSKDEKRKKEKRKKSSEFAFCHVVCYGNVSGRRIQ